MHYIVTSGKGVFMNIFVLDLDPKKAALYHFDKHVTKMVLETSQMLCTALHLHSSLPDIPYKPAHPKHPCTIWAASSISNYDWLCDLGRALAQEYTHRYNKIHKCAAVIDYCSANAGIISRGALTQFAQAMPDEYKSIDAVIAYRNFYRFGKAYFSHVWTRRERPSWW